MRQDISEIRKVNDIQFNISLARLLIKLIKKFAFCFILLVTCKFVSLEKKKSTLFSHAANFIGLRNHLFTFE